MERTRFGHTDLVTSTFCMGCMQLPSRMTPADVDVLVNCFRDAGGDFFDTAHCYCFWEPCGDGASERILGDYVKRHACRDDVVIATKGAHPSAPNYRQVEAYLSPGRVAADIDDSLARLQTDVIDLYWLHRDDPRLDVGAILDILNAEVKRGRIRYFGGSNWTSQRLAEANRYAGDHGIASFAASQPRWSLLNYEPMSPEQRLEPGVLLTLNDADRQWHSGSQLPVVPYGPTGNGYFATGGAKPERWQDPQNTARAARATQLAERVGATPNQVALAWLLSQPFPVVPILGTSQPCHLTDALGADSLALSADQLAWLETGAEPH